MMVSSRVATSVVATVAVLGSFLMLSDGALAQRAAGPAPPTGLGRPDRGSANPSLAGQTAADGWSGQVQCVLSIRAAGYQDEQTHTWVLSGAPNARNDFRDYPVAWTVTGSGNRTSPSLRAAAAVGDSWTRNATAKSAVTLFVPLGTNTLRVSPGQPGQRATKAAGAVQSTGAAVGADADEWIFAPIDIPAPGQNSTGSRPAQTRTDLVGWRQPAGTPVVETCSWNLAKGAPSPASALTTTTIVPPLITTISALPDLAASLSATGPDGATAASWPANAYVVYVADVKNQGLAAANGATVKTPPGTGLSKNVVTCTAAGGARCPSIVNAFEAEAGMIIPVLPSGGSVQFAIATTVTGAVGSQTSLSVTATATAGDANNANNSATMTQPVVAPSSTSGSQHFLASGIFTVPQGVTSVIMEIWGAGGGGAVGQSNTCSNTSCAGGTGGDGGGSGAYTRLQATVTAGATLDVTIGAAGYPAADGGTTQVRLGGIPLVSANGGKGGKGGGAGGTDWLGGQGKAGNRGSPGGGGSLQGIVGQGQWTRFGGAGGAGAQPVAGSITPVAGMGGGGGTGVTYLCSQGASLLPTCHENPAASPGSAGGSGFARISW